MANRKRKSDSINAMQEKIRRLELQLTQRKYRRRIISTSTSSSEDEEEHVRTCSTATTHAETTSTRGVEATPGTSAPAEQRTTTAAASSAAAATASPAPAPPATTAAPDAPSTADVVDITLDDDILLLLGDAPEPEIDLGNAIHKDIASRWQEILSKGLSKDAKEKLLKEYLVPKNCDLLVSPVLNPEVKAALPESLVKRDASLSVKQKQLGIALSALAQTLELVVKKECNTQKILKPLGDACRILCDSHYYETRTRRGFVIAAINADLKDTVIETKRDKFLFGCNIAEQLKSAKTIKRSGSDLKQNKNEKSQIFNKNNFNKNKNANNRLNSKATPRKPPNKSDYSRYRPTQRPATKASFQQRGKSERSPARRSRRQ